MKSAPWTYTNSLYEVGEMSFRAPWRPFLLPHTSQTILTVDSLAGIIKHFRFLLRLVFKAREELRRVVISVFPVHYAEALENYRQGHETTRENPITSMGDFFNRCIKAVEFNSMDL